MGQKKATYIPEDSSPLQEKFISMVMERGKKSIARRIFSDAMNILKEKGKNKPEELFLKAIETVKPQMEIRAKRVGGSVYQIPVEVNAKRQLTLSMRWIISSARSKKGQPMAQKLANELTDASNSTGAAYKKKEDVERMAAANKAFAHFAKY
ncbi:30S ribosomal protein S7 [Candidatus Peregrinibacteria bacterium]|nr:30S ribosomal protein S7 [Candidatus Peregrinibacteria bacterium]